MHICLFEDAAVQHLEPLTLTRHTADLRLGAFTLAELQRAAFRPERLSFHARRLVAAVTAQEHPNAAVNNLSSGDGLLFVNARLVPDGGQVVDQIRAASSSGEPARRFVQEGVVVAAWLPEVPAGFLSGDALDLDQVEATEEEVGGLRLISRLWDLVDDVEGRIAADFALQGKTGTEGARIADGARITGDDVLIEPGAAVLPGAVINAVDGPIWIAEDAVVEENAVLKGPVYIGPKSVVKATARIDASALGYWCKVGGEVHGSVFHSLSAKPHDGYVGNSYLGRWCNLGADTNTSNLKNDYGEVTMFDPVAGDFLPSGRQFLGLVMGDHSKSSINSMFNTGTVVGVSCNVYGSGFPPRLIPSFAWGGAEALVEYRLDKALRVAEAVMARRETNLSEADRQNLTAVFEQTAALRNEVFG